MNDAICTEGPVELCEAFQKHLLNRTDVKWMSGNSDKPYANSRQVWVQSNGIMSQTDQVGWRPCRVLKMMHCVAVYDLPTQWDEALKAIEELIKPEPIRFEDLPVGTMYRNETGFIIMKIADHKFSRRSGVVLYNPVGSETPCVAHIDADDTSVAVIGIAEFKGIEKEPTTCPTK